MGASSFLQPLSRWADRFALLRRLKTAAIEGYLAAVNRDHVPLRRRFACWRNGFFGNKAYLYDFKSYPSSAYLSDYEWGRTDEISGRYGYVLGDKVVSHYVFLGLGIPTPRLLMLAGPRDRARLEALVAKEGCVIIKPRSGGGGTGVRKLEFDGQAYIVNGVSHPNLASLELTGHTLVLEFARQASYATALFAGSANTIRFITMREATSGVPFVAFAVHRIGTVRSSPVDNFDVGGVSAFIDVATGVLGPAMAKKNDGTPVWFPTHPDTGAPIAGVRVPRWEEVVAGVVRAAHSLPGIDYVGWDIVVTDDGFTVIEGNNTPGVEVLQVHRPLLLDPRVTEFYRARGVIKRAPVSPVAPSHTDDLRDRG